MTANQSPVAIPGSPIDAAAAANGTESGPSANPTGKKPRVFFPNLDGLRFVCFFMVFLFHINKSVTEHYLANQLPVPNFFKVFTLLFQNGNLGVNFFFVLSGFLITFLLIREKEYTGRILVGNFYIRRILRIWPLFYLCVFIGFVVFPKVAYLLGASPEEHARPLYYILFINNFDVIQTGHPNSLILGILWSIAIEEQFYLSWPLLLSLLPLRYFKYAALAILTGSLIFRFIYHDQGDILYFHTCAVIGDMALGGLLAWFTSYPSRFLHYITNMRKIQIVGIYVIALALVLLKGKLFHSGRPFEQVPERLIIGLFFGFIIVEQNFAKHSFFKFAQFRRMTKLGIYTYGLYCLHFIGIYTALAIVQQAGGNSFSLVTNLVMALMALIITIGIALLSYHLFEKKFLSLKDRFAVVTK